MTTERGRGTPAAYREARKRLVADTGVGGEEFRRALAELTDDWLAGVFAAALEQTGLGTEGLALVALGGYGRGGLWPNSDLDLAVIHRRRADDAARLAEAVWYPVWDTGVHLGHSVRSVTEAPGVIDDDVASGTALLGARPIAGDPSVVDELLEGLRAGWVDAFAAVSDALRRDAEQRRARLGDVAFSVEPNLKLAGGGLRDAQIPGWLGVGGDLIGADDTAALAQAAEWLGDVRLALHRGAPTSGEVLHLEDQDAVAAAVGCVDADAFMTQVAGAARRIDWVLDEVWDQVERRRAANRRRRGVAHDEPGTDWAAGDPAEVLRRAAATAQAGGRFGRAVLARIAAEMPAPVEPWDQSTRDAFVGLLGSGPGMIRIVEALDQVGVWERFLPEWAAVRTRAQRTTHHRYTVDRHLLETVVLAADHADRVARSDLLVVAALLHDLGKGRGGDHTDIGVELAARIAARMGFDPADAATLGELVRHHLLLPEVATRRDIADATTIRSVAAAVPSVELLGLLVTLTEADARATGPTAWTDWKAGLVHTLVERVGATLTGTDAGHFGGTFPSTDQQRLLDAGVTTVIGDGRNLTVVAPDRPGLFWRVAGALVLAGLNVVSAEVTSSEGMALEVFGVTPAFAAGALSDSFVIDWSDVGHRVESALAGRVAIAARVAARATTYQRRIRTADAELRIRFDDVGDAETGVESVLEVDAPDGVGVLFAITHALAELDVDIRYARVETQTDRVIDAFSIVGADGSAVVDTDVRAEIERAIRYALDTA